MPTYEYRCEGCGHELELFQNISESPKKKCPSCKKQKLKRKIGGGAGFLFKGSGFYLTDYRSDSYKKAAEADSKSGDSKASDSKPSEKSSSSSDSAGATKADAQGSKPEPSPPSKAAPKDKKGRK